MESVGLKFEQVKKIQFGDLKVTPKVDKEMELRLRNISFSSEPEIEEAKEVLSSCFGADSKAVKNFMDENLTVFNLSVLQAYLLGGNQAVDMILNGAINMGVGK